MNVEDTLDDEEKEEIEKAKTRSKRSKTKYGSMLNDEEDDD